MSPAQTALAEAAALETAHTLRRCRQHHHATDSSTGPADPQAITELTEAVFGDRTDVLAELPWAELLPAERTRIIRDLRAAGHTFRAIGRTYGIDPKTARKWAPTT